MARWIGVYKAKLFIIIVVIIGMCCIVLLAHIEKDESQQSTL